MTRWIKIGIALGLLVAGFVVATWAINHSGDDYLRQAMLDSEHTLLSLHHWGIVKEADPKAVEAAFAKGFTEGKALVAAGTKVKTIVRYETKEVPVESPCDPGAELDVKASVTEAVIDDVQGSPFFKGRVVVSLDHPSTAWHKDIELPIERASINYRIATPSKPEPARELHKWHLGKSIGCGVGVVADVNMVPAPTAGAGVGVFCGVAWGLVK